MAEIATTHYVITHAEIDVNPKWDASDDNSVRFTVRTNGGQITSNGKVRETPRLAITTSMLNREVEGSRVIDKKARTVEFTMTTARTGRKARTGTDLSVFDL